MDIILLLIGFFALVEGANLLIAGSSQLATRLGVSELIVGLTVVAFGTSLPELIVNLFASGQSGELAIANVVGSNIANILLILGVTAVLHPLTVHRTTVYREIVFNVGAAAALGLLVSERFLSEGGFKGLDRVDGAVLMSYFLIFIYYTFGRTTFAMAKTQASKTAAKQSSLRGSHLKILFGAAGLWAGGKLIVDSSISIATALGVSEAVVGLTIVALGTSLPELAASVIAVRSNKIDIAVGNAVGSNLFNVFWVLGLSALINPLEFDRSLIVDIIVNLVVAVALFLSMVLGRPRHQISKKEGLIMVSMYISYMAFIVIREL